MKNTELKNRLFINFEHLTFDVANRKIDSKQVEILKESVVNFGVLRPVVVVFLKGKKIVVDGQHLATALKGLKMPIECAVVPCENDDDKIELMSYLNRIANKWTLSNYINAYKENGNKHYEALISILDGSKIIVKTNKNLKIQDCLLHSIYSQKARGIAKEMIEKGTFTIPNRKQSDILVQQVYDCQRAGLPSNSRKVNEALIALISEQTKKGFYNHSLLLKNIKAKKAKEGTLNFSDNESAIKNELRILHESTSKKMELVK